MIFFLLQDILPGLTIRSKADLCQFQAKEGSWNGYLCFAGDPAKLEGSSILKWRCVVVPSTEEEDSGEVDTNED